MGAVTGGAAESIRVGAVAGAMGESISMGAESISMGAVAGSMAKSIRLTVGPAGAASGSIGLEVAAVRAVSCWIGSEEAVVGLEIVGGAAGTALRSLVGASVEPDTKNVGGGELARVKGEAGGRELDR